MISAQADTVIQEQLIEKYMLLPNQVWDDIISQASKVCHNICSYIYKFQKIFYNAFMSMYNCIIFESKYFSPECGCLKGPRGRETTRQHLKNKC